MQTWSFVISEEILQTSRILVVLKEFLCEENKDLRIVAKVPSWLEEDLEFLMRKWTKGDCHRSGLAWRTQPKPRT